MSLSPKFKIPKPNHRESGQALIEYALIAVLVAIIFGTALAATGPIIGNVFSNSITDLMGQNVTVTHIPGKEDFWLTVTYAHENPAQERPMSSNTPAPPTSPPTDGPSPTATEITPSATPSLTNTPTLTSTPPDVLHELPWYDSVDAETVNWWRVDPNINTSGSPWDVQFFTQQNLTEPLSSKPFSNPNWLDLDFTGDSTNPWVEGLNGGSFSARFARNVQLERDSVLTVRVLADDGVRVKVQEVTDLNEPVGPETVIIDQWGRNAGSGLAPQWFSGSAEISGTGLGGSRTRITVEYNQKGGGSRLKVLVQGAGSNPDDSHVTNGGTGGQGAFSCGWGQNFQVSAGANDANTELGMWDEFIDGELPNNSRCNLELRGAVNVPASTTRPQLVFWSVWDLKSASSAWLEVTEYIQETEPLPNGTPAPEPSADRGAMANKWIRVNLHTAGTRNYNWTRHVVDLRSLRHSDNTPLNFNNPLTFRFVIQKTNGNNDPNRWYIDDIRVHDAGAEKVFKLNQPVWDLDNEAQIEDFIFTGGQALDGTISGWGLTSNHKLGQGGMSFHDSVGPKDKPGKMGSNDESTRYKRHSQSPNVNNDDNALRINYLEFNGWIDLDPSVTVDALGNKGEPVLSFYQAYQVGSRTGLEVQWTADPFTNATPTWRTFGNGVIRNISANGSIDSLSFQEHVILLKELTGNPSRIRIRFVQKVHPDATRRDGWWIDEIRVGREETPRYLDYPFYDDAQYYTSGPMRYSGMWGQTDNNVGRRNVDEPLIVQDNIVQVDPEYKRISYSSSPHSNYAGSQVTYMETRFAVDMFNDTHTNPMYDKAIWNRFVCDEDDCVPSPDPSNTHGVAATRPILSFYHWRDLGNSDGFEVQWKRIDAAESAWKTVWFYDVGLATNPNSSNVKTLRQHAWEYVEIDLQDMMKDLQDNNTASVRDDDVVFRFKLNAMGWSTGQGIFIDDISLKERPDENTSKQVFRLWPSSENRKDPINNQSLGNGNGISLYDDPDASVSNRSWDKSWFAGGDWFAIDWDARQGFMSFHDSPVGGQYQAPTGFDAYVGEESWKTLGNRFSVLELDHIIDLRAVDSKLDTPMMSFWTRYHLGQNHVIRVEISEEMRKSNGTAYTENELNSDIRNRCRNRDVKQCYEQRRGWTPWRQLQTKWEINSTDWNGLRSYGWTRSQVDLTPYTYDEDTNRPGKRVRIRFVYDTLNAETWNPGQDGWYIDYVNIEYTNPTKYPTVTLANANYDNSAETFAAMLGEGKWGLDPNIYEGGGGGPATIGLWTAKWWNCQTCASLANNNYINGAGVFLQDANRRAPDYTNQVTSISYNMGNGKPQGAPSSFPNDRFVGEFTLDTPVVGTPQFPYGDRAVIAISDDGVRMKVQEILPNGDLGPNANPEWNVLSNWRAQSPTTTPGILNFKMGKRYRITLQYVESDGGAQLSVILGEGRYSFSDSPRLGGAVSPDEAPIPYSNTSLMIDRLFDLRGLNANTTPVLGFRTKYRLNWEQNIRVEVSQDGGFTWVQDGLNTSAPGFSFNGPNVSNAVQNPYSTSTSWQQRWHNLTRYKGTQILIRFRFDRRNAHCARTAKEGNDSLELRCMPMYLQGVQSADEMNSGFFDGWWISRISIMTQ